MGGETKCDLSHLMGVVLARPRVSHVLFQLYAFPLATGACEGSRQEREKGKERFCDVKGGCWDLAEGNG